MTVIKLFLIYAVPVVVLLFVYGCWREDPFDKEERYYVFTPFFNAFIMLISILGAFLTIMEFARQHLIKNLEE